MHCLIGHDGVRLRARLKADLALVSARSIALVRA
jgi:hypothetical protein